jgi:hypothetical protein
MERRPDLNKAKEQEQIIEHKEEYELKVSLMYECAMLFHKIKVTKANHLITL